MVARELQRELDGAHRVAGDGVLEQPAVDRRRRAAAIDGLAGRIVEQHAVGAQQRLDLAHGLLHARQARKRRAQAAGRALVEEAHEPVACRHAPPRRRGCRAAPPSRPAARPGRRCRSGCPHRVPSRPARAGPPHGRAGSRRSRTPLRGCPRRAGPGGPSSRSRARPGAWRGTEEHAGARRGFVGAGPHGEPAQALDAGGVELVAVDAPAARRRGAPRWPGRPPRAGEPSAGSTRSALISAPCVRPASRTHALAQVRRPAAVAARQRMVLQVGHGEDQRRGGLAARHGWRSLASPTPAWRRRRPRRPGRPARSGPCDCSASKFCARKGAAAVVVGGGAARSRA